MYSIENLHKNDYRRSNHYDSFKSKRQQQDKNPLQSAKKWYLNHLTRN